MASRKFNDDDGVDWTVWMTQPSPGAVLHPDFAQGWLTFQSASGVRRRLAPAPATWESCSCEELGALCRAAALVQSRQTPMPGTIVQRDVAASEPEPPRAEPT